MHSPTLRVIKIINLISSNNGLLTLSDISKYAEIPIGTLHPILRTLTELNFVSFNPQKNTYSIGIKLFISGNAFIQSKDSLSGIEHVLEELTFKSGETSHFAKLDGGNVLYLAKVESMKPVRMYSAIGKQLPAYGTSLGKALMSGMTKNEIKALYPNGLIALTEHTITDFDVLYSQIESIREVGFAYECEESNEGVRCIAVPVEKEGRIVAAISIGIPVFRYTEVKKVEFENMLKVAKVDVEKIITYLDYI